MGDFQPPVAYVQTMENALDSYPWDRKGIYPETAIAHGVQKDALQNSLDAEDEDNPQDFTVEFEMRELNSPDIITITDSGTTGLTGKKKLTRSEIRRIMGTDRYSKERWSRFQALGYSHPDDSPLKGARGQGKFIFIGASESKEMVFDSLRGDGTYRVGHWGVKEDKPIMNPKEGDEAKEYIAKYGLDPLEKVGTRIIIPDPVPELWRSFHGVEDPKKCDLYRYISSTWWEALQNGRSIKIILGDSEKIVEPPDVYRHYNTEPDFFDDKTEERTGKGIQEEFPNCVVEELVIAYSEEKLPPELQGIALQRNEMTVERFNPSREITEFPSDLEDHIFGWIILNEKGDMELKKTEKASHYHLNRRKGSLARHLFGSGGWLRERLIDFAEERGHRPRGRRLGTEVTTELNQFSKNFGYENEVSSGGKGTDTSGGRGKRKIQMNPVVSLDRPREGSRKMELGEKIENIEVEVRNYSDTPLDYELEVNLKKKGKNEDGETSLRKDKEKLAVPFPLIEQKGTVDAQGRAGPFTRSELKFDENRFDEGIYILEASAQTPTGKYGKEKRKLIYLGRDPIFPESGIFKEPRVVNFSKEGFPRKLQYLGKTGGEKRVTLFINNIHPLAKLYQKRGADEPTKEYSFQCGVEWLMEHDFTGEERIVEEENFNRIKELLEKNPEYFENVLKETSRRRQELLFDAFSG